MNTKAKYRVSLNTLEIEYLLKLTRLDIAAGSGASNNAAISSAQTLTVASTKISNQMLTPAYNVSAKPKANSLEALGAAPANSGLSKEEIWEICYMRYNNYGPEHCSLEEIAGAKEHMYLHDLFPNEEEKLAFENSIDIGEI